jgi:hypothetical protein
MLHRSREIDSFVKLQRRRKTLHRNMDAPHVMLGKCPFHIFTPHYSVVGLPKSTLKYVRGSAQLHTVVALHLPAAAAMQLQQTRHTHANVKGRTKSHESRPIKCISAPDTPESFTRRQSARHMFSPKKVHGIVQ